VLAEQLLAAAAAEMGSGLPQFIERPRSRLFIATLALKAQKKPKEILESHALEAPFKGEESVGAQKHFENLISAIKAFAVKVAAYADPDDPSSEILSSALLTPLVEWLDTYSIEISDEGALDEVGLRAGGGAA
jgi:hypothetical protein